MAWGIVQVPGEPDKLSVYATEAYYTGPDSRLRRFTYRADGFVSLHADTPAGELPTKPLRFPGTQLKINFCTSGGGNVRVKLQDAGGGKIDGYRLQDCHPIQGDSTAHTVRWTAGSDAGKRAGQPLRIRFELQNADIYSYRFAD